MRRTFALLLFACFAASAHADPFDDWCKTARLPASSAICSDPGLLDLTRERQHAYDEAKARLSADQQEALLADQNAWLKSYPKACGLAPDAPPSLPLPPAIRDCMAAAGRARIAYLRAYGSIPEAAATAPQATAPEMAGASPDFDAWHVGMYAGPTKQPDFAHAPPWFYDFRTRIRSGAAEGANFAGRVALERFFGQLPLT